MGGKWKLEPVEEDDWWKLEVDTGQPNLTTVAAGARRAEDGVRLRRQSEAHQVQRLTATEEAEPVQHKICPRFHDFSRISPTAFVVAKRQSMPDAEIRRMHFRDALA